MSQKGRKNGRNKKELKEVNMYLRENLFELNSMADYIAEIYDFVELQSKSSIKDINNFKRELKRDGLYSEKLEDFIEQYMLYYNK